MFYYRFTRVEHSDSQARYDPASGIVATPRLGLPPTLRYSWRWTDDEYAAAQDAVYDHGFFGNRSPTGLISVTENDRELSENLAARLVEEGKKDVILIDIRVPKRPREPYVEFRRLPGLRDDLDLPVFDYMLSEVVFLERIPAEYITAVERFN